MTIFNLLIFILALGIIYYLKHKEYSLAKRIAIAFLLGIILGTLFHVSYTENSPEVITQTLSFTNMIGNGYVRLLLMMVIPLISISLFSAILNLDVKENMVKKTVIIILFLLFGALIGALAGVGSSLLFHLGDINLDSFSTSASFMDHLQTRSESISNIPLQQRIIEFIPVNIFADLAGSRQTSTLGVVIFSLIAGSATLGLKLRKPEKYQAFTHFVNNLRSIVLRMTKIIIELTPYAIIAIITALISTQSIESLMQLFNFVVASYVAIIAVFLIQWLILAFMKLKPSIFLKKSFSVLMFGFVSRSSAGTLPLTVQTLRSLGVKEQYASLTSSLGLTIGQAGCAGVYPAMLAMIVAPSVGIDPLNGYFILKLVLLVLIASFGVAGVGGGATAAALIVLPILGFPIIIVGVLMAVEPLIDMARTALNINSNLVTGLITSKISGELDQQVFNDTSITIKSL